MMVIILANACTSPHITQSAYEIFSKSIPVFEYELIILNVCMIYIQTDFCSPYVLNSRHNKHTSITIHTNETQTADCRVTNAVKVIGEKWKLPIILNLGDNLIPLLN